LVGTINGFIVFGGQDPSSTALVDVQGRELSYGRLRENVGSNVQALNAAGFRPNDRIALIMPNGPMMAMALLTVASGFTCVPLNPGYRGAELEWHLAGVGAKCILTPSGFGSPAKEVASRMGIELVELEGVESEVGAFRLKGQESKPSAEPVWAGSDDVAFMMHTSGTTSRPKLVALTNAIVAHSIEVIAERLRLTPTDRGINFLQLFHVHGQMMVLTSLAAGSSIVCAPAFDPERILSWVEGLSPTWYSAVPTMHIAILEAAKENPSFMAKSQLRFIRSASSALPVRVISELEDTLRVPVIEAYGMTEASHGISCNPLPPGKRVAGSVGIIYRGAEWTAVELEPEGRLFCCFVVEGALAGIEFYDWKG